MTDEDAQALRRENDYLKRRNAQMQDDLTNLSGEVTRLQQQLGQMADRRSASPPNPLSGGQ